MFRQHLACELSRGSFDRQRSFSFCEKCLQRECWARWQAHPFGTPSPTRYGATCRYAWWIPRPYLETREAWLPAILVDRSARLRGLIANKAPARVTHSAYTHPPRVMSRTAGTRTVDPGFAEADHSDNFAGHTRLICRGPIPCHLNGISQWPMPGTFDGAHSYFDRGDSHHCLPVSNPRERLKATPIPSISWWRSSSILGLQKARHPRPETRLRPRRKRLRLPLQTTVHPWTHCSQLL